MNRSRAAIGLWLAGLAACVAVISQTRFTADMSAFLPRAPTAEQRILVDQLRDGALSRLVLAGIAGADAATRAELSRALGDQLRQSNAFLGVHNGEAKESARDREYFFANRYLLSSAVTPERFSAEGLRAAIGEAVDLLASPAGMMLKSILPRDPTGETLALLDRLGGSARPRQLHGVWASPDGERALLIAQTRASGSDIDGQQQALALIDDAFARAKSAAAGANPAAAAATLLVTGTGAFAVASRATIHEEVVKLSLLSAAIVITLLLVIYRSVLALALGLLPVVSGGIVAVAAVSLGFGEVHGLTLGFGTTLIGEAVDYSIYLFVQSERSGTDPDAGDRQWAARFWPTIRLGVLTSICGFASLLFSGFPGLAQLGLYSITGLVIASLVTRYVLPGLLPRTFRVRDISALGARLDAWIRGMRPARWLVPVLAVTAAIVLYTHRDTLWNRELSALSPVSADAIARDHMLRTDVGAPDASHVVVASGPDQESALRGAEQAAAALRPLVDAGHLGGFESPSFYLPSEATQAARRAALPAPDELRRRLAAATTELPLRAERLEPFVADVEATRGRPPLQRADLAGTSVAEAVDALLMQQSAGWTAVLPLRAPAATAGGATGGATGGAVGGAVGGAAGGAAGTIDPARVRAALAQANVAGALFIDVSTETQALYAAYLRQAILLSLAGLAVIAVLLLIALRSAARTLLVMAPLLAAVLVVAGALVLAGKHLTIMHLIGMLLIVAIGSNYALFFDQRGHASGAERDVAHGAPRERLLASLLCANLTAVGGFGLLAFSSVPVLQAIGITVGPGAILALVFAALSMPGAGGANPSHQPRRPDGVRETADSNDRLGGAA